MTISSTLLALALMPLCLWIYSRAWINTPLVQLLPLGAVTLTLCSTLIPIGLGVFIRYKYNRVADYIVKVRSLLLPTLGRLGVLGPEPGGRAEMLGSLGKRGEEDKDSAGLAWIHFFKKSLCPKVTFTLLNFRNYSFKTQLS